MISLVKVVDWLIEVKLNVANAVKRTLESRLGERFSVLDFGAVPDWDPITQTGTDSSAAFQAAIDAVSALGGGSVYVPKGSYLINNVRVESFVTIFGDGEGSRLYQYEDPGRPLQCMLGVNLGGGSSAEPDNARQICIRDLKLIRTNRVPYPTAPNDYQQHFHMISVFGGTAIDIRRVRFEGFNGDGVYLSGGGGQAGSLEVHNYDVRIVDCYFHGIDWQNRNAISIIDCEGLLIKGNIFRDCTNPLQPGPIDIEPNANTWHRSLDIQIIGNRFSNCKGSAACAVCTNIPNVPYTTGPRGLVIADNIVDGVQYSVPAFRFWHLGGADNTRDHQITLVNNIVRRCERPFFIGGVVNVLVHGNKFSLCNNSGAIGSNSNPCFSVDVKENTFNTVGMTDGRAINIYQAQKLSVNENRFINCGPSTGSGTIVLLNAGSSNNLEISNNVFENINRTVNCISSAGHTLDVATTKTIGNSYINCSGNTLACEQSDELELAYTPIVYGNNSAGTGTYSKQLGRWTRRGKWVTFRAEVVTTAHDGSGIITLSLPTLADTAVAIETVVVAQVVGAGATAQGVAVGRIYNVVGSGTAGCRFAAATADAYVQFTAGGALTVRCSGTYRLP